MSFIQIYFRDLQLKIIDSGGLFLFIKEILRKNPSLAYSFLNKAFSIFFNFFNLILITTFLSATDQGFYYTFNNLLIFQLLLDFGFGFVLTQFISHEWAFLELSKTSNKIEGDEIAKQKLAELIQISLKYYRIVALIFFVLVGGLGFLFLRSKNISHTRFELPWFLLCISVSLSIVMIPLRYFMEGSNHIHISQKILSISAIVSGVVTMIALYSGAGLFVAFISSFTTLCINAAMLFYYARPFLNLIKHGYTNLNMFSKKSFFKQQWKIAVSWFSGYIMFSSFVPIAFYILSPVEAGKVGSTLQLYNGIFVIGYIFVNVVSPQFGILYAKKEYRLLFSLSDRTIKKSFFSSLIIFILVFLGLIILTRLNIPQVHRVADLLSAFLILLPAVIIQISNVETAVIRFQKKEPFMIVSIICAILMIILMLFFGAKFGLIGMSIAYSLVLCFILTPLNHFVYKKEMNKIFNIK